MQIQSASTRPYFQFRIFKCCMNSSNNSMVVRTLLRCFSLKTKMHMVKQKNAPLQSTRVNYCYISIWCWLQYGMVLVARSSLHLNFTNFIMHYLPLTHFEMFYDAPKIFWWMDTDYVFHVFAFEFPTYTIYISFPFSYTISICILSNINRWQSGSGFIGIQNILKKNDILTRNLKLYSSA